MTAQWVLIAIAGITILSGVVQIVVPEAALGALGFTASVETIYLLRLVSLLTALFGGALLHTAWTGRYETTVVLWSGLQKVLGAAAVLLAVLSGMVAGAALLIAGYDFLAGLFVLWFWRVRTHD